MCGVAGFWDSKRRYDRERLSTIIGPMLDQLRHRGPDRGGTFIDETTGLALGVRRLAINDLSSDGDQPMRSSCGRWTITLNGEIYNFQTLRRELEADGARFRGHADTEVLLKLIERHGLDEALRRSVGMFAFALWDNERRSLTFVRDRLGKKPLYLGWMGGQLVFGSELKALAVHPGFSAEVNRDAMALFLLHQYVPAPHSIWHGIFKLPPGTSLTMTETDLKRGRDLLELVEPYWLIRDIAERGARDELVIDQQGAIERADELLKLAVNERMIADVPLGTFLSGGIDSSLVAALMQENAAKPIRTFTVGFNEEEFSEAEQASKVARHLGTDHTEFLLTPEETLDVVLDLPDIYDEPFADPSQVPTYHVAKLARGDVTVCLSGDGGDEVFGGYGRYQMAASLDRRFGRMPSPLRQLTATMLCALSPASWDSMFSALPAGAGLPHGLKGGLSGDRLHKLAGLMRITDPDARYAAMVTMQTHAIGAAIDGGSLQPPMGDVERPHIDSYLHRMMYYDTVTYLPDGILVKVDRASMSVGLEVRSPLLDHRLIEFAWRLPADYKLRGTQGKWLLRQLFERHLPASLADRPKQGFSVPISDWLRGPLRDWAEALIEPGRLSREGFLDPDYVQQKWREHRDGTRNWGPFLWCILMFQAWHTRWVEGTTTCEPRQARRT